MEVVDIEQLLKMLVLMKREFFTGWKKSLHKIFSGNVLNNKKASPPFVQFQTSPLINARCRDKNRDLTSL
jgi:hypothetical protein